MSSLPSLGPRGEGWLALQFVLLALVALSGVVSGQAFSAGLASLAGVALMMSGAALLGRGLMDLGSNLTPLPHPRDDAQLVESGVYGLVRHPLYGGLILTAVGWSLVSVSFVTLALTLVLAVFFDLKSRREEAWLSVRFSGYDVLDVDDLTAVEIKSREAMLELLAFYRANAPGFEQAWVMLTAPQLGARHSRRLVGAGRMIQEDWKVGRVHVDEVGISPSLGPNFPSVSVPYGALLPAKVDNLLVAGRHISTDAATHTFMREIPQCWMTGHAAGVAAGLAADKGVVPRRLDVADIQSALRRQGAHIRDAAELAAAED